ncbi:nucleoporin Nup85-like protein [Halteromyces radiatus]|uniref:nucleoporin Nup85-like protein n=1 Tax=Halteromyces radiatus TaxID=101107 RepID=UPI00221F4444|nr:nucleoporin Nup85-like protein [Halteromyces radiatus]KAI8081654.1 nucleoporin Nup85-like protein [Halteromyces radiatus]
MVELIDMQTQVTSQIRRKRLKFYRNSAQVFRLLHGIYSTEEEETLDKLRNLNSSSSLDAFVDVYTTLLHDYCDDIKYDKGEEAKKERLVYQQMTVIWQLLQILFFSQVSRSRSCCYGAKLMTWLNNLDRRSLLQFDIQGVFNSSIPSHHSSFWSMVYKLTLRGQVDILQQLFGVAIQKVDDPYEKSILQNLNRLMQTFPLITTNNELDKYLSIGQWRDNATNSIRELGVFAKLRPTPVSHAITVLRIMSGDTTSIYQQSNSVIEAIVSNIYYYNSDDDQGSITIETIKTLTQQMIELGYKNNNLDQHVALLALLKGNMYEALEQCAQLDWWLLAHMTDILDIYSLQRQQDGLAGDMFGGEPLYLHLGGERQMTKMETRVFFILTFANKLVMEEDMWKLAFDYMGTCGMIGRSDISKAIDKIPLTNDHTTLQIAEYCTRNGLLEKRQCIYQTMADQLVKNHSYLAAIRYYCLAGKYDCIEDMFKTLLWRYGQTRQLICFDELDPLYLNRCNGPQARFYFELCKINSLFKNDKLEKARDVIVHLLLSEESPMYFLPILFAESITVMEQCCIEISTQVINELDVRLSQVVTLDNQEGILLLRSYLGRTEDDVNINKDLVDSLLEIYRLVLYRSLSS